MSLPAVLLVLSAFQLPQPAVSTVHAREHALIASCEPTLRSTRVTRLLAVDAGYDDAADLSTRAPLVGSASGASSPAASTTPSWLIVLMTFTHVLANALIAQAVPTALLAAFDNDRVRTARALGRLASCAALLDIVLAPQLGRISDTIGRRPLLLAAPAVALCFRSAAALFPLTSVLVGVKLMATTISSTYMVALKASLADQYKDDAEALTGKLGLVSSSSGGAYALGMYFGGYLVKRKVQLPYFASASMLAVLLAVGSCFYKETLPLEARVPFGFRPPAFGFLRLFRSGRTLRRLSAVSALQVCLFFLSPDLPHRPQIFPIVPISSPSSPDLPHLPISSPPPHFRPPAHFFSSPHVTLPILPLYLTDVFFLLFLTSSFPFFVSRRSPSQWATHGRCSLGSFGGGNSTSAASLALSPVSDTRAPHCSRSARCGSSA